MFIIAFPLFDQLVLLKQVSMIMIDELRHHNMAKEYFLKYYPNLQPGQLLMYKFNIKNRKILYKKFIKL